MADCEMDARDFCRAINNMDYFRNVIQGKIVYKKNDRVRLCNEIHIEHIPTGSVIVKRYTTYKPMLEVLSKMRKEIRRMEKGF